VVELITFDVTQGIDAFDDQVDAQRGLRGNLREVTMSDHPDDCSYAAKSVGIPETTIRKRRPAQHTTCLAAPFLAGGNHQPLSAGIGC
jgi:hypothetical protein